MVEPCSYFIDGRGSKRHEPEVKSNKASPTHAARDHIFWACFRQASKLLTSALSPASTLTSPRSELRVRQMAHIVLLRAIVCDNLWSLYQRTSELSRHGFDQFRLQGKASPSDLNSHTYLPQRGRKLMSASDQLKAMQRDLGLTMSISSEIAN